MKLHNSTPLLWAVVMTAYSTNAFADVTEFDLVKIEVYEQDSDAVPTAPVLFILNAFVEASPGDAGMISINGDQLKEFEPGLWELVAEFADPFLFEGTYPSTAPYQLNLNGGSLGTQIENMSFPPEAYPNVPAFTPESFLAMQGADPYLDLTLEWVTPVDANLIVLSIYDSVADDYIVDTEFASGTSYTIPAGVLTAGRTYEIELIYANVEFGVGDDGIGFGSDAQKLEGFVNLTATTLTTAGGEVFLDAGVLKGVLYEQTLDDTPPGSAIGWGFEAFFDANPDDIAQGEVTGGTVPAMLTESTSSPGDWDTDDGIYEYASKSMLDADFPSNTEYLMSVSGETLGARAQSFSIGADAYPAPGYLVGDLVSMLNNEDFIDDDITLTWSTPDPSVDYVAIFIDRFNAMGGIAETVVESVFPVGVTEFVIPGGTLFSGGDYELGLTFVNGTIGSASPSPGFGTGTLIAEGFLTDTVVSFSPINQGGSVSCADINGDGSFNFFDVSAYLILYQAQDPDADFNGDGDLNFFDVSAFLISYQSGGC